METIRELIEILGQIIGFFFAYHLLRLAYKFYQKDRVAGAVLVAWASVFMLLCSLMWLQARVKSFIGPKPSPQLAAVAPPVETDLKATAEMHDELTSHQAELDKLQTALDEVRGKIGGTETNVDTIRETTTELHTELAIYQAELDKHQAALDEVQGKIQELETNVVAQQSAGTNESPQILSLQSELAAAQANFAAQKKQLSEIQYWLKSLYEGLYGKTTNDLFNTQSNP
jgi:septal ring factor EnvC (AmiA/AmiB activator)